MKPDVRRGDGLCLSWTSPLTRFWIWLLRANETWRALYIQQQTQANLLRLSAKICSGGVVHGISAEKTCCSGLFNNIKPILSCFSRGSDQDFT